MNPLAHKLSRVAASLLATITLATMIPHVANAVPETAVAASNGIAAEKCTDVIFIGARGSGEPSDAGQPKQSTNVKDKMQGFGDTVASMAYSIKQQLPQETTTSFIPVDYMALSVAEAMKMDSKYPTSVKTGVDSGTPLVKEAIASCPWSKIILMGYSQGAHVMHEIVMRLDRNERDHISSALLIADPIRYPENHNTFFTYVGDGENFALDDAIIFTGKGAMRRVAEVESACEVLEGIYNRTPSSFILAPLEENPREKCKGVFSATVRFSDVMTPGEFPEDITNRVLNVCNEDDIVCQVTLKNENPSTEKASALLVRPAGVDDYGFVSQLYFAMHNVDKVHGEGYKEPKFYVFPSQWSVSMVGRSPKLPEKPEPAPEPSPSPSHTQTPAAIAAPIFGDEDWRTKGFYLKERGASSYVAFTNNADGAVLSFEALFNSMAWEFSNSYHADEDSVSSEEEKNKLIDQQLFRTMEHIDRASLGTEKVDSIFSEWAAALAVIGSSGYEIRASRDGVQVSPDGTVTITAKNIFYKDSSSGEIEPIDEDSDGEFKLAYKKEKWVVVDVNIDGPLQ